jgi:hypothetical protein
LDAANNRVEVTAADLRAAGFPTTFQVEAAPADAVPPTVTCDAPGSAWYPANVSIQCTAIDTGSGLANRSDARFDLTTSVPGGSEDANASTNSREVCDAAGNCVTAGPIAGNKIDQKAPQLRFSQSADGANGWFVSLPAATLGTATDANIAALDCQLNGVDSGGSPTSGEGRLTRTVAASAEGRHAVECAARDAAGNVSTGGDVIRVDISAPRAPTTAIDRPADYTDAAGSWFKDQVTISFGSNGDPDLFDATPGSGVDPASLPSPATKTSGAHMVTASILDNAGNRSADTSLTVNVDARAPQVGAGCPSGPILLGSTATADVSASDGESGLAVDPTGAPVLDTSSVGARVFTSAEARDNVGHAATATCTYRVIYDWAGFTGASSPPALNKSKAGQTEKLYFTLGTHRGLDVFAAGSPTSQRIDCNSQAPIGPESPVNGSGQLGYESGAKRYLFSWRTDAAWDATCRELVVRLNDGTEHRAYFDFRSGKPAKVK